VRRWNGDHEAEPVYRAGGDYEVGIHRLHRLNPCNLWISFVSIFRHAGIYLIRPAQNPAF
jgi:hypothetical protein